MKLMLMTVDEIHRGHHHTAICFYNKTLTIAEDIDIVGCLSRQLIDHPELILLCDYCERQLNLAISMIAVVTSKEERWDTCVSCFSRYMEQFSHYYVRPCTNFTITSEKWSIGSHLLLLQALQK